MDFEDVVDEKTHKNLIENVLNLSTGQYIKKPTRTEPALQISEYNLVKPGDGAKSEVRINDLTRVLKKSSNHVKIGKKIKSFGTKSKTLQRPLEKPQAEKIRRVVGYKKTKQVLKKWDPVVTSNRASLSLVFPLKNDLDLRVENENRTKWRVKSDLQKKLEEHEPVVEEHKIEETQTRTEITYKTLLEKRGESAKLRAHQSYKEAKARRQNKIKSKKFHRIQRKEKTKEQMKEFELLQKTDPGEALKKLEEIERARAQERASLRHRSTGKWAQNKQIRAKYDKESRQILAQQLAISRDLTQKTQQKEESESEEEDATAHIPSPTDPSNLWENGEIGSFVNNYRKYWLEQSKTKAEHKSQVVDCQPETSEEQNNQIVHCQIEETNDENKTQSPKKRKITLEATKTKKVIKKKKVSKKADSTTQWNITSFDEEEIDEVFDNLNKKLRVKLEQKKAKVLTVAKNKKKSRKKKPKRETRREIDLTIPKRVNRPIIDEPLLEGPENKEAEAYKALQKILDAPIEKEDKNIDIDELVEAPPVTLGTAVPDFESITENEENEEHKNNYSEAFEDQDLIKDFTKEKRAEIDKEKPKDVNMALPGWGSWGGTDIPISKRKKRRFIVKFPKNMPRKDKNRRALVINENANNKMKEHRVSELPFPFKTVKDYEASVRAPLGSTFVPEIAFRKLVKPAVITKMGQVIEPLTEDVLLKKNSRK